MRCERSQWCLVDGRSTPGGSNRSTCNAILCELKMAWRMKFANIILELDSVKAINLMLGTRDINEIG